MMSLQLLAFSSVKEKHNNRLNEKSRAGPPEASWHLDHFMCWLQLEIQWSWSQNAFGQPGPGLFDTSPHLHDLYHHTALTSSRSSPFCRQQDLFVSPWTHPFPCHHFWATKQQWHGMTSEHDPLNAHACLMMQLITPMLHMMMLRSGYWYYQWRWCWWTIFYFFIYCEQ